jgi:hypothetical protein
MDISDGKRDYGLDAARGAAVILMFIVHTAPGDGPFKILQLAEFISPPMFALVIAMSAQISSRGGHHLRITLVRAGVLIVVGLLLLQVPSQIVVVLVVLGVLVLVCGVLIRLPTWSVVGLGLLLLVFEPWAKAHTSAWSDQHALALHESFGGRRLAELVNMVAASPYDRLTALTIYVCVGIVLVRLVRGPRAHALVATAAFVGAAAVYLTDKAGGPQLHPYSGTHQVLLFNVFAVVAVSEVARWMASRLKVVGVPLSMIGDMWLTLYVVMVLSTAAYLRTAPASGRDDSWVVLGALIVGSLLFAAAWKAALKDTPFARGPIEGVVGLLAGTHGQSAEVAETPPQHVPSRT